MRAGSQGSAARETKPGKKSGRRRQSGSGESKGRRQGPGLPAGAYAVFLLEGALVALALDYLFYRSVWGLLLLFPVEAVFLSMRRREKLRMKKRLLHYRFKDVLTSLHTAMRAGYSLENAVREAYGDLRNTYGERDAMTRELYAMCNRLKLKAPAETLFEELGERSGIEDIQNFAGVLQIAKRTGGSMDRILHDAWRTLSGKIDTKQEIDAGMAAKKYEQTVMSIMPAGIILYLGLSFPDLLEQMYTTGMGRIVMSVCLAVYAAAYFLGRKMVDIEV